MHEREFIEWIRREARLDPSVVLVGPGDDCAVVAFGKEKMLITTDQVLDGVHFILAEHGPRAAGRKAMARNLSDVAAMPALPLAAVATVALPENFASIDAQAIYTGLREIGDQFECPVVGGDIGVWSGALSISVTIVARMPEGIEPVRRSGARPNQAICATGELGGAWRTRKHLEFTPRIKEAIKLAGEYRLGAMIDISDGLAADLHHICTASGVAGEIVAADIPVREGSDLTGALSDGEDYELLFTLPEGAANRLCEGQPLPVKVTRIGRVTEGEGVTLITRDGSREPLKPLGWEHETKQHE